MGARTALLAVSNDRPRVWRPGTSSHPLTAFRQIALLVFFVALAGLEIAHGVFRLETLRERQRQGALERSARDHSALAESLRTELAERREHAAYLGRAPSLRRLLASSEAERGASRRAAEDFLLPYLVSFRGADRVRLLDVRGRELLRCERMGQGVGSVPETHFRDEVDAEALRLAGTVTPGAVAVSSLLHDAVRVEVPPENRFVLDHVVPISTSEGTRGILVLTVYAESLLERVRGFEPVPGSIAVLVDDRGDLIDRAGGGRAGSGIEGEFTFPVSVAILREIIGSAESEQRVAGGRVFSSTPVREGPSWFLIAFVSDVALDAVSEELAGGYAWVIGSVVAITAILAAAAAFFVRLSARELELREKERRSELERRLQLSDRLGALGLLTAGVAHEINNPLEGIGNYLALLERDGLEDAKRVRYVGLVRHGFERIRDIVRDLSSFARPSVSTGRVDLARVVDGALRLGQYAKDLEHVEIERIGFDAPLITAGDAGRLEQVVLNLVLNAGRIMNGRGRVRVEGRRVAETNGDYVEVIVEDEGPGIPRGDLDRIFDPFFTTTGGTGLGLSISYGIVRAHGGALKASNRAVGGASFALRLPATRDDTAERSGIEPLETEENP
jgi:signal transduction histidine kinase